MRKTILALMFIVTISSCQRQCASFNKQAQTGKRDYEIVMYSGGDTVFYDKFRGILNDSKESDGCYYFKGDTLIELSGDYVIKSK